MAHNGWTGIRHTAPNVSAAADLEAAGTSAIVADALDALGYRHQALGNAIRPLWPQAQVVGVAYPVVVVASDATPDRPYEGEMAVLDALQPGDVAVVQVADDVTAALWGELFSCAALGRGALGVVIDGLIRDAQQIEELGFPAFACGFSPLDTKARARVASHGETAVVGGIGVTRGDVVVADRDGVVVVPSAVAADVAAAVAEKRTLENGARDDLLAGMRVREVWEKYGVF